MQTFRSLLLMLALSAALAVAPAQAQDLAEGFRAAREIVARHLSNPGLNSAYGTPAFDATGRRIADVYLNFCGRDASGNPMLYSLVLHPDGRVSGEDNPNNPRPDTYGHHLNPPLQPDAWLPPEEIVGQALTLHAGHAAPKEISLAYYTSKDHHGRAVIVLYWHTGGAIHDVVIDAKYGDVLAVGETPWPDSSGRAR